MPMQMFADISEIKMTKLKYLLNIVLVLSITLGAFAQAASNKKPECSYDPKVEKLLKQMIGDSELASVIAQNSNALTSYAALEKDDTFDNVLDNPKALRTLLNMPRMSQVTNNE